MLMDKSMNPPLKFSHKRAIRAATKKQSWLLLLLIVTAVVIDVLLQRQLVMAKSVAIGACLSYAMQMVFTAVSYRRDERLRGQHRHHLFMQDVYVAALTKWMVGIVGFSAVFIFFKSLNFLAFFIGFIAMQLLTVMTFATSK